jgi:hypothetical protein
VITKEQRTDAVAILQGVSDWLEGAAQLVKCAQFNQQTITAAAAHVVIKGHLTCIDGRGNLRMYLGIPSEWSRNDTASLSHYAGLQ